jgi:predicted 2-oxoglutarate/Fe(II)-dependent dioxygenase YbiX
MGVVSRRLHRALSRREAPMRRESLHDDGIFVIHEFLSPEQCDRFIATSESAGYEDAPITTSAGFVMRKDIRNNDRLIVDDPTLAQQWYERAREFLPPRWLVWEPVGLNERFRYYRYDVGQKFAPHSDGCFLRETGERSWFTFMVYLNDGYEGGETIFHEPKPMVRVRPERGKALVFYHHQLHEGGPIVAGRKYVLRTDVMYRRTVS